MVRENWKNLFLVSTVQVLSQGAFFVQGILWAREVTSEPFKESWFSVGSPFLYAAIHHLSGPLWRRLIVCDGNRWSTMVGATIVPMAVAIAAFLSPLYGHVVYSVIGGAGMGLVSLRLKSLKSGAGGQFSLWGIGVSGTGLALWPLLACLFTRSHGTRYSLLPLAGVALHAVPVAQLLRPASSTIARDEIFTVDGTDDCSPLRYTKMLPDVTLIQGQYRLTSSQAGFELYKVRPHNCVEVLPGIPEEDELEDDQNLPQKKHTSITMSLAAINPKKSNNCSKLLSGFPIFVATTLLRLGDELSLCIVVSVVPILASYLHPDLRIEENAFLVSLCGFSKLLAELPILAKYKSSKEAKHVLLAGPILASAGLYFVWRSTTLDAITMATVLLGIGSGASSATSNMVKRRRSPGVEDAVDVVIGSLLLAMVPLARISFVGRAVQGYSLLGTVVYAVAAVSLLPVLKSSRKRLERRSSSTKPRIRS